jgi:hypothetical protein
MTVPYQINASGAGSTSKDRTDGLHKPKHEQQKANGCKERADHHAFDPGFPGDLRAVDAVSHEEPDDQEGSD